MVICSESKNFPLPQFAAENGQLLAQNGFIPVMTLRNMVRMSGGQGRELL